MKYLFLTLLITISMSGNATAQTNAQIPCTAPECSQFDFWIGDWALTYNDTMHAANRITKEMGGCLIHEHFNDAAKSYSGESWSVYNPLTKLWQQTWVDNQGGYIVLSGVFKDGRMTLFTEPASQPDGTKKQYRMVYYNITTNSFDWDWESTTDDGKTWKNNWRIHYKRKER